VKLFNLLIIFVAALICLLFLQSLWLYHTYQLNLKEMQESINLALSKTTEQELNLRYLEFEKKIKEDERYGNGEIFASFDLDADGTEDVGIISKQYNMIQQVMKMYDMSLNIFCFDSIFSSLLQENRLPTTYCINYTDSLDNLLGTVGQEIDNGFQTNIIPIVNGEKIQATVKISHSAVFKNMLAILTVSILILLFIIACLIYEIRMFLTQHHLNQLRENFTHALTHDMKTPLATIYTVLYQLDKGNLDDQPEMKSKFSAIAMQQTLDLQAIINQILTLAYIENNQLVLNKQTVDLPQTIQSLIDKFSIKGGKNITFSSKFDLNESIVCADPFYLNNTISNLIDNAIKYSGESVKIEIECTTGEKQVYIKIKDNGFGIAAKDQQKIFKRFERGAEIKRNQTSGFGIGLNYVQKVIEAHGGAVALLSKEGVGSEFVITIPILLKSIDTIDTDTIDAEII
jgi:two-component system phosphate regulon sensor histidine kinase PhoR